MLKGLATRKLVSENLIDNEQVFDADKAQQGSIMAFDFGEQRIGVATGEPITKQANPLTTIDDESNARRFTQITQLVSEWQPSLFIVGLPYNLAGEETDICQLCRKFARRLNGRFNIPVLLIDERFSSAEASEQLDAQGVRGIAQKPLLDQFAACSILQSYFDTMTT